MSSRSHARRTKPTRTTQTLRVESLEARDVPAVDLLNLANTDFPSDQTLYVPISTTGASGTLNYSVSSSTAAVNASLVTGGRTVLLNVTGTDKNGVAFSGGLTLRLFEDTAPLATSNIISLVKQHYYDGKLFHRIVDNFVIQGGSPNGDGVGGSTLVSDVPDEFDLQHTFSGSGLVAMANAGDDNNNAQFFITDIDQPLAGRPEFLNFNHSIVGILTSGFDTYQKIITTNVVSQDSGNEVSKPTQPVTITSATILDGDPNNAVIKIKANNTNFNGGADIQVKVDDAGDGSQATRTFSVSSVDDATNSRAFLGPISAVETTLNKAVTFSLPGIDLNNDALTYAVGPAGNLFGSVDSTMATVNVNQSSGTVTVTPASGFLGSFTLLVGVRDQTNRVQNQGLPLQNAQNFDTQSITVTVTKDEVTVPPTVPPVTIPPTTSPATVSLAASQTSVGTDRPVLLTATVTNAAGGTVQFFDGDTQLGQTRVLNNKALFSPTFNTAAAHTITAKVIPAAASSDSTVTSSPVVITATTSTTAPIIITADEVLPGNAPNVVVKNTDGTTRFTLNPYGTTFTGGVHVAVADVTGDGQLDVVTTPGFGGGPIIAVFDGASGTQVYSKTIFESFFRGGLSLAVGDSQGLGYAQILVGAGFTGGPRVTLLDARRDLVLLNYFAYDSAFRGGANVSMADIRGGGQQYILTSPGEKGGPVVKVFDPTNQATTQTPASVGAFNAGTATDRSGIRVGVGPLLGSGTKRNVLVGPIDPKSQLTQSFDLITLGIFVD